VEPLGVVVRQICFERGTEVLECMCGTSEAFILQRPIEAFNVRLVIVLTHA
jgi:hypothetical protein